MLYVYQDQIHEWAYHCIANVLSLLEESCSFIHKLPKWQHHIRNHAKIHNLCFVYFFLFILSLAIERSGSTKNFIQGEALFSVIFFKENVGCKLWWQKAEPKSCISTFITNQCCSICFDLLSSKSINFYEQSSFKMKSESFITLCVFFFNMSVLKEHFLSISNY